MTARERLTAVLGDGADFIRALVGAWDCCGTCAGGVLAKHDAAVAAAVLDHLATELGSGGMRGDVTIAIRRAPFDVRRQDQSRNEARADAALGAVRARLGVGEA